MPTSLLSHRVSFNEVDQCDHIYVYSNALKTHFHHGIVIEKGSTSETTKVLEFNTPPDHKTFKKEFAGIRVVNLNEFCKGRKLRMVAYNDSTAAFKRQGTAYSFSKDSNEEILDRVNKVLNLEKQGNLPGIPESSYSLLFNNCEHLVMYCTIGVRWSEQVSSAISKTIAATGKIISSVLSAALKSVFTSVGVTSVINAGMQEVISEASEKLVTNFVNVAIGSLAAESIGNVVGSIVMILAHSIWQFIEWKQGMITKDQFVYLVAHNTITRLCSCIGSLIGGLLVLIPIPVASFLLGTFGSFLGGLIGQSLGSYLADYLVNDKPPSADPLPKIDTTTPIQS